ncbi:MAG: hypothetical protein QF769_06245 [Candidatus Marinimicrobia bacterium]|nr:hypothetical protein [Candidatus Neomarinimicrobiota bacterium]
MIFSLTFLINGCEEYLSDDSFLSSEGESYASYMENGWNEFSIGNYEDAISSFQSASERDATQPEVYLGLGWSHLRLHNIIGAEFNFQKVLSFAFLDEDNTNKLLNNAYAGLSFLELINGEYESVIDNATRVIDSDVNYVFEKDESVNASNLNLCMAEAHYYLSQITEAFNICVLLGKNFTAVSNTSDTANVNAHYDDTSIDGLVQATIANSSHLLIAVDNAVVDGLNYVVSDVSEGTANFDIVGNPVPEIGDVVLVEYAYTYDYPSFMFELLSIITE